MKRNSKLSKLFLISILSAVLAAPLAAESSHQSEKKHEFNIQEVLVHHLMDSVIFEWNIGGQKIRPTDPGYNEKTPFIKKYTFHDKQGEYKYVGGVDMHITRRVMMMFIMAGILILVMVVSARVIAKNPFRVNGRFVNLIETLIQFVRNDVVDKNMHHEKAFEPYILTVFFFILFSNLLGLFPPFGEMIDLTFGHHDGGHGHATSPLIAFWPGITVTGDVAVTISLALITTLLTWYTGFRYQGLKFLVSCIPHGMPIAIAAPLYLLLFPLELVIGPIAKGVALTIRLLANMTAGHVIILVLLGFIFQFHTFLIAPVSVFGASAIYLLELFVAFLQAFIFALLSALFIGSSMHSH